MEDYIFLKLYFFIRKVVLKVKRQRQREKKRSHVGWLTPQMVAMAGLS